MQGTPQTQLTAQEIVETTASIIEGIKQYAESAVRLLEQLHTVEDADGKLARAKEDLQKIKSLKERIGAL